MNRWEQRQASWLSQERMPLGAMRWGATVFFAEHKLMIVRRCWIAVCHRALVHPPVTGDNKSRGAVLPQQHFAWQTDSNSSYVRIHIFIAKDISAKKKKHHHHLSRYSCQLTPLWEIFAYRPAQLCSHNVSGVSFSPPSQVWFVSLVEAKLGHVAWMWLMVLLCFYLSAHKSLLLYLRTFSFPLASAMVLIKKKKNYKKRVAHGQLSATKWEQKSWKLTIKQRMVELISQLSVTVAVHQS